MILPYADTDFESPEEDVQDSIIEIFEFVGCFPAFCEMNGNALSRLKGRKDANGQPVTGKHDSAGHTQRQPTLRLFPLVCESCGELHADKVKISFILKRGIRHIADNDLADVSDFQQAALSLLPSRLVCQPTPLWLRGNGDQFDSRFMCRSPGTQAKVQMLTQTTVHAGPSCNGQGSPRAIRKLRNHVAESKGVPAHACTVDDCTTKRKKRSRYELMEHLQHEHGHAARPIDHDDMMFKCTECGAKLQNPDTVVVRWAHFNS